MTFGFYPRETLKKVETGSNMVPFVGTRVVVNLPCVMQLGNLVIGTENSSETKCSLTWKKKKPKFHFCLVFNEIVSSLDL